MSRERLMAQQRARLEAMRERKLAEQLAQAEAAKRLAPSKPKSGKEATKALNKFLTKASKKGSSQSGSTSPKAAGTKPVQKQSKTSPGKSKVQQAVAANKPTTARNALFKKGERYGGPPITGEKSNTVTKSTRMGDHPALSKNKKSNSKKPAFKVIKGVLHVLRGGKYVPTKKSR